MLETVKGKEFGVPGVKGGGQKNHPCTKAGRRKGAGKGGQEAALRRVQRGASWWRAMNSPLVLIRKL